MYWCCSVYINNPDTTSHVFMCQQRFHTLTHASRPLAVVGRISVEDMSTIVSALDVSVELEVQGVWCCHLEARLPEGQMTGHFHHWDHVLYLALLIVKVGAAHSSWNQPLQNMAFLPCSL